MEQPTFFLIFREDGWGQLLRHSLGLASLVLGEDHLRLSEAGWANLHRAIGDGFQFCIVCRIATNIASAHAP